MSGSHAVPDVATMHAAGSHPLLLLTALLLAACGDAGGAPDAAVTTDSAGVAMVHSEAPALGEDAWRVSEAPVFAVGDAEGADDYWFGELMGMTRLRSGTVVVADMQRSRLAFYRPDGRFVRAVGRQGEGPGEHRQIMRLHRLPGDSLLVEDFNGFGQVFDSTGTLGRRISLSPASGTGLMAINFFRIIGPLGDGRFAALAGGFGMGPDGPPDSSRVYRLGPTGEVEDSIFTFPTGWAMGPRGDVVIETFAARQQFAAAHGYLYAANPSGYRVELRDGEGRLRRVLTRAWVPAPVTEADLATYRERYVGMRGEGGRDVPPRLQEQRARIFDESPAAEHHPAFLRVLVDGEGNLWLQERALEHQLPGAAGGFQPTVAAPARWNVFDREGVWVTSVTTPANFRVFEIGADYVLGLARDDFEVEQVRVYQLRRTGGAP